MEIGHNYNTRRFGQFIVFLICTLHNFQKAYSQRDSIVKAQNEIDRQEFFFRLNHFMTFEEFATRPDSIKTWMRIPYAWSKYSMGHEIQSNTYYIETRGNPFIPISFLNKISSDNVSEKSHEGFEMLVHFNQCHNLDPKVHFEELKKIKRSQVWYSRCIFNNHPITEFISLPNAISLSIDNCIYKGSLLKILDKNTLEGFSYKSEIMNLNDDEIKSLMNSDKLHSIYLNSNDSLIRNLDVSKLVNLEVISLKNFNLIQIPNGLFDLPYLRSITLSNNRITKLEVNFKKYAKKNYLFIDTVLNKNFDNGIQLRSREIYNLNYLDLSNNLLGDYSIDLSGCNAHIIELHSNLFTKVPKGLYTLPETTTIILDKHLEQKVNKKRLRCKVVYL